VTESANLEASSIASNWRVVGASVCGTGHQKRSLPCQDYHAWQVLENGALVAAVADGAGSAAWSQIGSEIAVKSAISFLADRASTRLYQSSLSEAIAFACEQVKAEARDRDIAVRELASTLIVAVATAEKIAIVQIGDGAAILRDRHQNLVSLTVPQTGEYANETTFLVSEGALESAQYKVWEGQADRLALFSDGLQLLALKMPEAEPHAPFFAPLFQFISQPMEDAAATEQLEKFLRSDRVSKRTDDDLTLLLACLDWG